MLKQITSAAVASLLLTAPAFADVMLDLRTTETHPTTQPAVDDSSVSVLAVPGRDFFTKFTAEGRTLEASGLVEAMPSGRFRVKIKLESRSDGQQRFSTTVEVKPGEELRLSGLQGNASARATVLTVKPIAT